MSGVLNFEKDAIWSSNLNNHTKYSISIPQYFFQFYFGIKVYFCHFWYLVEWGEREIPPILSGREKNMSLTPIWATKINDIYVKLFHLMREVDIMCFGFFKSSWKKQIWIRVHFLFQVEFGFGSFFRVFKAMNKFIMVSNVFWVKRTLSSIFRSPQWLKYEQNRQRVVCSFKKKKIRWTTCHSL
jgi:hypothetical protein